MLQIIKMVLAATVSWWLSINFLNTEYPFLSPWVALLTIDATAYRTLTRGAQSVLASLLGLPQAFTHLSPINEVGTWWHERG